MSAQQYSLADDNIQKTDIPTSDVNPFEVISGKRKKDGSSYVGIKRGHSKEEKIKAWVTCGETEIPQLIEAIQKRKVIVPREPTQRPPYLDDRIVKPPNVRTMSLAELKNMIDDAHAKGRTKATLDLQLVKLE